MADVLAEYPGELISEPRKGSVANIAEYGHPIDAISMLTLPIGVSNDRSQTSNGRRIAGLWDDCVMRLRIERI